MAPKTVAGSNKLSSEIKRRRQELNLTIEEAAGIANVGVKTWCRYEAGASIRQDKLKGVLKALEWIRLPDEDSENILDRDYYERSGAWSKYLLNGWGEYAAISFAAGCEVLLDLINEDLGELSKLSKGTHLGQLRFSMLADDLPPQFLPEYDYEFVYRLKANLIRMMRTADSGHSITVNSILDELTLYLIYQEAELTMETCFADLNSDESINDWIWDVIDDIDLLFYLYEDQYLTPGEDYYFENWGNKYREVDIN